MSLDRSLRSASSLARHRNVLSRAERLTKLVEAGKWNDDKSPLGLVKVGHRKMAVGGKVKEAAAGAAGTAAPAAGAAPAGGKGAAAAPAAAAAAPAGGKGAAAKPAAKGGKK